MSPYLYLQHLEAYFCWSLQISRNGILKATDRSLIFRTPHSADKLFRIQKVRFNWFRLTFV
jgi:hypothetical protein